MFTRTNRKLTEQDRRSLPELIAEFAVSYGCFLAFMGIGPIILLGWFGGVLGSMVSITATSFGRVTGSIVGLALAAYCLIDFTRYIISKMRQNARDRLSFVERLDVASARVIEIAAVSDNEPIFVFQISEDTLLYLQGQWLRDDAIYGAPEVQAEFHEDVANRLPPPFSFPNKSFILERLPHSGKVLSIRVRGEYLPPESTVNALRLDYDFRDSELFIGRLTDINEVLSQAHHLKNRKDG